MGQKKNLKSIKFEWQNNINIKGRDNILELEKNADIAKIKNNTIYINGNGNHIILEKGLTLYNNEIKIHGNNSKLLIQEKCHIKDSCLWIEDSKCQLLIGWGTNIIKANLGATENTSVIIGKNCFIEHLADVRSGDSHSIIDLKLKKRINNSQDINIGNSVWLARKAWILKGVNIGNNCIVTESSIVTKDIPDNSLVSGVPATIKRTRVIWKKEKDSIFF